MSYQILNGNELLIQGGLEAGFDLYTGYPGSPLADFFNILFERKNELHEKGIKVVLANSEANAAAMASGAKMAGKNVLIGMKSMGLHVASDALSVGNFANPGLIEKDGSTSGVVIAVGDDPWSISTSTPADSRYLFKHLHIPFLEPSTPQELKDWMSKALELSQKSSVYAGVILTTFMAEGGGRVKVGKEKEINGKVIDLDPAQFNLQKHVMVPPNSLVADKSMIEERFPQVLKVIQELGLDKIESEKSSKVGFISSGATYEILKQVLEESHLIESVSLYKVASSFPLNENQLVPYLNKIENLIVVEEKRGFLEAEIREVVSRCNIKTNIFGKYFDNDKKKMGFPSHGGLNYEIIVEKIDEVLHLLEFKNLDLKNVTFKPIAHLNIELPKRLPTFCPGCPHRETLSLLKDLRKSLKDKNINLISHGDVGCYSLSFLEPFKEMHDLSAMGQGGALGAGTDIFVNNPSVVLMGDSTFFHSGMTGVSNSVQLGHNITYIILDNDNTAMTGHQMTPVSGISVEGDHRPKQDIMNIVKAMKVSEILEVNPSDRYFYKNILNDFILKPGVKVIISNKECGLTYHGRMKKYERQKLKTDGVLASKSFYQINTFACEDCRECVESTGCPGLSQTFDAYGTKVQIDPQICVADSYCTKIKVCPSFELVEVTNYHPEKYKRNQTFNSRTELTSPDYKIDLEQIAKGKDFRLVVIGVGGSGVTTISRVLAEAALEMDGRDDLDFKFVDQKGLAQRNGSVTSHLSIFKKGASRSQVTPIATADVVISPDLLEGSRAVNFLSNTGKLIIDNDYQMPLSILLDRGIKKDPINKEILLEELTSNLSNSMIVGDFKNKSFQFFNKSVYASAMLLGCAFQEGLLPFSQDALQNAIKRAVPKNEIENNLKAFELGRLYIIDPNANTLLKADKLELTDFENSLVESLYPWQSKKRFVARLQNESNRFAKNFPEISLENWANYLHDLMVYDQGKNIENFYTDCFRLHKKLSKKEFKRAVIVLAKTYWIKDEVFVAHILSSSLKTKNDKSVYLSMGEKYEVTHINRPHFDLLGFKIEFDINTKDWMLKVMKHFRLLRILLPNWHRKEREIAERIRNKLLNEVIGYFDENKRYIEIKKLDSIKGYREVRYAKAQEIMNGQNH